MASAARKTLSSCTSGAANEGNKSPNNKHSPISETEDAIQRLSIEEVHSGAGAGGTGSSPSKNHHKKEGHHHHKKGSAVSGAGAAKSGGSVRSGVAGAGAGNIAAPQNAEPGMIFSGHSELNTLWASNDQKTGPITVNVCNAPNNSTVQCGCENINCPFCNLMLSIEKTDPTVLQ